MSISRRVIIAKQILGDNQLLADENRGRLDRAGVFALNIMASPGAGKTSLIEKSIQALSASLRIAVIDGDLATSIDADRAQAAGAVALQINTAGACHLDAAMLRQGLDELDLEHFDLLLIENVGNLICPHAFDLGAHANLLIASTPEGDDKPYKYPVSYRGIDALVVNKIDLLPYLPFDMQRFQRGVSVLNPELVVFPLSCLSGEGIPAWLDWLADQVRRGHA